MEDKAGDHWVKVLESAKIAVQFKRLPLSYRISGGALAATWSCFHTSRKIKQSLRWTNGRSIFFLHAAS